MSGTKANIREKIKYIKHPTNEQLIELWNDCILTILECGNLYSGNREIPMFSELRSQKEKILYCLIKIQSLKDEVDYQLSYGREVDPGTYLMYRVYEGEDYKWMKRDFDDLSQKADELIKTWNENILKS